MDQRAREEIAAALLGAYDSGKPIDPPTERHPDLAADDAYEIQLLQVSRWTAAGARVAGHKVGLTSAAMQRQMGVHQPDYGHLLDRMFWLEYEPIPVSRFLQPRVEPEIAFVLSRPLRGPGVTIADAVAAVGCVLPALELIDSRIRDWKIGLADTIADNASSGGVVLGGTPAALSGAALRLTGCNLYRNGALAQAANQLGDRGLAIEPGWIVLAGGMTEAVTVPAGRPLAAHFTSLGSVFLP